MVSARATFAKKLAGAHTRRSRDKTKEAARPSSSSSGLLAPLARQQTKDTNCTRQVDALAAPLLPSRRAHSKGHFILHATRGPHLDCARARARFRINIQAPPMSEVSIIEFHLPEASRASGRVHCAGQTICVCARQRVGNEHVN